MRTLILSLTVSFIFVLACIESADVPTQTPYPTYTPQATFTPYPTYTPLSAPEPENTPTMTLTVTPVMTPTIINTPEPVVSTMAFDDNLCRWVDNQSPSEYIVNEAKKKELNSDSAVTSSSVTNSKAGTVEVAIKPDTGDCISSGDLPMWVPNTAKWQLIYTEEFGKYYASGSYAIGDFDGDGVDDLFMLGGPKQSGVVLDSPVPACDGTTEECFVQSGSLSVFRVGQTTLLGETFYYAIDRSDLLINTNPLDMAGTASQKVLLADFNGDGKLDIFTNDTGTYLNGEYPGKNDMYFLSNEGPGWTESTTTHVTGASVQEGKGLIIFSHGATVGDIDNDGDMDIVVTSINWRGNGGDDPNMNGEVFCYINQGDGHMKVRRCGNQWGHTAELGDIDNDGDLDIVWGAKTYAHTKEWDQSNTVPGCRIEPRCNGAFNGILLNDGTGDFYQRGFSFPDDVKNKKGFSYAGVPSISVADLDGDGDLDVIRMLVGYMYAGAAMQIEENIGDGQFKTALYSEWCSGPDSKAVWPKQEGSRYNCWADDFKFGDFNKDGLIDIVIDRNLSPNDTHEDFGHVVKGGAVYMSTGKFTYDIIWPGDEDYPLIDIKIRSSYWD
jgi:hypothetical protein